MATTVSRPAETTAARIPAGVPPLRAGQGHSFLLRRLHSLSGIVPVGAFLVEHFISNSFATNGPKAYADQVKFLTGLPFATWQFSGTTLTLHADSSGETLSPGSTEVVPVFGRGDTTAPSGCTFNGSGCQP